MQYLPLMLPPCSMQCLQCFQLSPRHPCPDCGFPVCDKACAAGLEHAAECSVLRAAGWRFRAQGGLQQYAAITVIRLLQLSRDQPDLWERLMQAVGQCFPVISLWYKLNSCKLTNRPLKVPILASVKY